MCQQVESHFIVTEKKQKTSHSLNLSWIGLIIIGQCEIVVVCINGRGWEGFMGLLSGRGFSAVRDWVLMNKSIPPIAADNVKSECQCKRVCVCVLWVCTLLGMVRAVCAFSYAFRYTFVGFKYSKLAWELRLVRMKAFIIVGNNSTNRVYLRTITKKHVNESWMTITRLKLNKPFLF